MNTLQDHTLGYRQKIGSTIKWQVWNAACSVLIVFSSFTHMLWYCQNLDKNVVNGTEQEDSAIVVRIRYFPFYMKKKIDHNHVIQKN